LIIIDDYKDDERLADEVDEEFREYFAPLVVPLEGVLQEIEDDDKDGHLPAYDA